MALLFLQTIIKDVEKSIVRMKGTEQEIEKNNRSKSIISFYKMTNSLSGDQSRETLNYDLRLFDRVLYNNVSNLIKFIKYFFIDKADIEDSIIYKDSVLSGEYKTNYENLASKMKNDNSNRMK
jgi:hypothetical protein